jgi:hypothetical protein
VKTVEKTGLLRLAGYTFFEIQDPYYALVKAKDEDEAINIYVKEVAGTEAEKEEIKINTKVVSHEYAVGRFYNSYYIEHPDVVIDETLEEYFEYLLKDESGLMLLDGSLL